MAIKLDLAYSGKFISGDQLTALESETNGAFEKVMTGCGEGNDFLGWRDLPLNYDREEFLRIKKAAEYIKGHCDIFIVIGIGGSYLGARAAIEFVKSPLYNSLKKDTPDIYFAGNSLTPSYINELLELCEGKDVCLNVISKSGTTTEPALAFRIFRSYIEKRYGAAEAAKRIFVTTDKCRGTLKRFADSMGYETFVVPDDIGGRYSVLTAVGLLPIAAAGIDIGEMMKGAADARAEYTSKKFSENDVMKYAAVRNFFYRNGKKIELFASYDTSVALFAEWWKQLFGESEGKDGVALYPASAIFSTDLHSMGQWIQEGERTIFETVISVEKVNHKLEVPSDEANLDGLNFLAGKRVDEVNKMAELGTQLAHVDGGVPNMRIVLPELSEYCIGGLLYFFEKACGISGYLLGVNPFNQPGVEAYKKNMFALLNKPGYEEESKAIQAKL